MELWIRLILLACIIFFFAKRLVLVSEKIAGQRGWAKLWAGFLLLSFATTLPELFVSVSAAAVFDAPDLSLGNLLGSVLFNLFLVAVLDLLQGPGPVLKEADSRLVLLGGAASGLGAVAAIGVVSGLWPSLRVSPFSVILILCYIGVSRLVFSSRAGAPGGESSPGSGACSRTCWLEYAVCASVLLAAGVLTVQTVDGIALSTGLGRTFAGTIFLAAATSLPEASTVFSAARRGAYDMALGNILGANMLNSALIFFPDVFYARGSIFAGVSPAHAVTALLGILMTGALIIGIIYRSHKSFGFLGWDSAVIAALYLAGSYILFLLR